MEGAKNSANPSNLICRWIIILTVNHACSTEDIEVFPQPRVLQEVMDKDQVQHRLIHLYFAAGFCICDHVMQLVWLQA